MLGEAAKLARRARNPLSWLVCYRHHYHYHHHHHYPHQLCVVGKGHRVAVFIAFRENSVEMQPVIM